MRHAISSLTNRTKVQYLMITLLFGVFGLHRVILGRYVSAALQAGLLVLPLMVLQSGADVGVWPYVLIGTNFAWWFADLFIWSVSVQAPEGDPLLVKETTQQRNRDRYLAIEGLDEFICGPAVGLYRDKPIYEWIARKSLTGHTSSRAHFEGVAGPALAPGPLDLVIAPGLVYRVKPRSV